MRDRLAIEDSRRQAYVEQAERLIKNLSAQLRADETLGIVGFDRVGSLWKDTALRRHEGQGADADVAVLLRPLAGYDEEALHERIRQMLLAAYPGKEEDIVIQPRTLRIDFRTEGLSVDIVPIIPIEGTEEDGWQPSSRGEPRVRTSLEGQKRFIAARKEEYDRFSALVRLLKHWRNRFELGGLRSFVIELLVSHLQIEKKPPRTLEEGVIRFFLHVAQDELLVPVTFAGKAPEPGPGGVVVQDPVNPESNVTARITSLERETFVCRAREGWELLTAARNYGDARRTLAAWKLVFGPAFAVDGLPPASGTAGLDIVMDCFAADFDGMAQSTGLRDREMVKNICADVRTLARHGYLRRVSPCLIDSEGRVIRAASYEVREDIGIAEAPGNSLWPRTPGGTLDVVTSYTPKWHGLGAEEKTAFQQKELCLQWNACAIDTSFPGLSPAPDRSYASDGFGLAKSTFT